MEPAPGLDRCRTLTFLLLILFGAISTAQGQQIPTAGLPLSLPGAERRGPDSPIRSLPLAPPAETVEPLRIRAFGTIEEEFTDNVNQTKNDRKSEFRTSFAPGLAARVERPRTTINFVYSPRYYLPGNRPDDATLDHNLTLRSTWNPSPRLRLGLADDFARSTDFRDVEDPGTRRTGRRSFVNNRGTAEAAYLPTEGRTALSYTNVLVENYAAGSDDSQTHIVRGDADLSNPRLSFGGSYALTRGEFRIESPYWEHAIDGRARRVLTPTISTTLVSSLTLHDSDRAQDFIIGRIRFGGILALGSEGQMEAAAGADVFAPRDVAARVSPSIMVVWTQRFTLFTLSARYEEAFRERFQEVDSTGVTGTRTASLLLTCTAFRDLTPRLTFSWTENRFEQDTLAGGPAGTVDRTYLLEAGFRYLVLRSVFLTFGYSGLIRTSSIPTAEFYENRVRLGLTYEYNFL